VTGFFDKPRMIWRAQLVRGIAYGEVRRDGERLDASVVRGDGGFDGRFVERVPFLAGGGVAALNPDHRSRPAFTDARALGHGVVEPDQQGADRAESILDHGVGRERRRHRDQADIAPNRIRRQFLEHGADRLADSDRQIPRRGERLGARDDAAAAREQHRIGERAAGIEPEPKTLDRARRNMSAHRLDAPPAAPAPRRVTYHC
jgi:hypothetical protein